MELPGPWLSRVALILLLGARAISAQEPDSAAVSATEAACIASFAGAGHDPSALARALCNAPACSSPAMARALDQVILDTSTIPDRDNRACVIDLACDDLIRGHAAISAEALDAVIADRGHVPAALVLMAVSPRDYLRQLQTFCEPRHSSLPWLAASEIAETVPAPFLASTLLTNLHLQLTLWVTDTDSDRWGSSRSSGSRGVDDRRRVPATFPAGVRYCLRLDPRPGDLVLASSPRVVYARREVVAPGQQGSATPTDHVDDDQEAYRELWELAMVRDPPANAVELCIPWTSALHYQLQATQARSQILQSYHALLVALLARGLLPEDAQARFPPLLASEVHDKRQGHTQVLPAVVGITTVVEPQSGPRPLAPPQ